MLAGLALFLASLRVLVPAPAGGGRAGAGAGAGWPEAVPTGYGARGGKRETEE